jgi:hypothetical protein
MYPFYSFLFLNLIRNDHLLSLLQIFKCKIEIFCININKIQFTLLFRSDIGCIHRGRDLPPRERYIQNIEENDQVECCSVGDEESVVKLVCGCKKNLPKSKKKKKEREKCEENNRRKWNEGEGRIRY